MEAGGAYCKNSGRAWCSGALKSGCVKAGVNCKLKGGFTFSVADFCSHVEPGDVVKTLNVLYDIFDDICDSTGVYKVQMCVSFILYGIAQKNFLCNLNYISLTRWMFVLMYMYKFGNCINHNKALF